MAIHPLVALLSRGAGQQKVEPPPHVSDRGIAQLTAAHLNHAVAITQDPELKAHLATALATLQKYLASDAKEQQQALQGKMSPKIMASTRA